MSTTTLLILCSPPGEKQFAAQQPSARGQGVRAAAFEEDCEQLGERDNNDNDDNNDGKLQPL